MKHDWTADLLTYWDRLRGTRAAPDRSDISPRALGGKLPHIFILRGDSDDSQPQTADIPPAKHWQFRLAGTRLCTLYGRELRNTRFLSLWHQDVRPWLSEQLHLSGLDYRPLRLEHTSITLSDKPCLFETLLLPLHEKDGTLAWIGSMVALDQPLWLGAEPLINNYIGHLPEQIPGLPQDIQPLPVAATGMKSVLQVLLDRHHELTPAAPQQMPAQEMPHETQPAIMSQAQPERAISAQAGYQHQPLSHPMADSAFSRAILPQIEALMPPAISAETRAAQQNAPAAEPQNQYHSQNPAPLTVADLIKSIHPAAPQPAQPAAKAKPAFLKLITGGKDKG